MKRSVVGLFLMMMIGLLGCENSIQSFITAPGVLSEDLEQQGQLANETSKAQAFEDSGNLYVTLPSSWQGITKVAIPYQDSAVSGIRLMISEQVYDHWVIGLPEDFEFSGQPTILIGQADSGPTESVVLSVTEYELEPVPNPEPTPEPVPVPNPEPTPTTPKGQIYYDDFESPEALISDSEVPLESSYQRSLPGSRGRGTVVKFGGVVRITAPDGTRTSFRVIFKPEVAGLYQWSVLVANPGRPQLLEMWVKDKSNNHSPIASVFYGHDFLSGDTVKLIFQVEAGDIGHRLQCEFVVKGSGEYSIDSAEILRL